MNLADQMKALSKENLYRKDAFEHQKEYMKQKIESLARKGWRSCIVDFRCLPGNKEDFLKKYGKEQEDCYRHYDVEEEVREYFEGEGFTFKCVTNDISGGVRQDPYWTICW